MLVRYSPFGEWVNVYYDPKKTSEKTMLDRIRKNGCPNSRLIRGSDKNTSMNPYIAAGDTVQVRLELASEGSVSLTNLPKGWVLDDWPTKLAAGTHYLNVRTPRGARASKYTLKVKVGDQTKDYTVEIVKLVG